MYQNRNKSNKEEMPNWMKTTMRKSSGIRGWFNRHFRKNRDDFSSGKRNMSSNKYRNTGYYSKTILLLTVIPMVFILLLAILAIFGVADDVGMGLQDLAVDGLNGIKFLYLVSNMIENWFEPMDDGVVFLLGIPILALIIIVFVLDIVLFILYTILCIVLFIISIIISVLFIYGLCPGIVILEIVMVVKAFKEECSTTNRFWAVIALFVSLLSAIIFYVCLATM